MTSGHDNGAGKRWSVMDSTKAAFRRALASMQTDDNAVPVLLAEALGGHIASSVNR